MATNCALQESEIVPPCLRGSGLALSHGRVQGCIDVAQCLGRCRVFRPACQFGGIDVLVVRLDPPDVAERVADPADPGVTVP
jgi:hypothetical protein